MCNTCKPREYVKKQFSHLLYYKGPLRFFKLAHVAYSTELVPSDYHLFASLEHALIEERYVII